MLLNLLKRDLRLHRDALVIPVLILILILGAIGMADDGPALLGLVLIGFLYVPILPLAIHAREDSQGTLADLMVLPVSRRAVVSLRYLEVLLFLGLMLALAHLGTWIALCMAAHKAVPFYVMDRSKAFGLGLTLLFFFAYPMPLFLRLGLKGISLASLPIIVIETFHWFFFPQRGEPFFHWLGGYLTTTYPGPLGFGILALFALSYLVSLKAFEGKDF